jgi:hypothetical protein
VAGSGTVGGRDFVSVNVRLPGTSSPALVLNENTTPETTVSAVTPGTKSDHVAV